jgi:hypothetical protein
MRYACTRSNRVRVSAGKLSVRRRRGSLRNAEGMLVRMLEQNPRWNERLGVNNEEQLQETQCNNYRGIVMVRMAWIREEGGAKIKC